MSSCRRRATPARLTVDPATLTYTASGCEPDLWRRDAELTGTVTGFVNGQTLADATTGTLTFTTPANAASNVGTYAIDGSGLTADNGNYVFVQAAGNASALTVDPATLTYTASGASQTYGGATPTLSGTVTGFVNGQTLADATTGTLTFSTTATAESNVGNYAIDGSGLSADNSNYVFVQAAGNASALTVDPATLTYTATGASQTYGGTTPTLAGTVTGFVNGQKQADATTGTLTFSTPATAASNVGTYAIDGSGLTADNGNYVFVQAAGNASALTVDPATLTYTASGASQTYGSATPTLTGTVTGFVNGQTHADATTGTLTFATTATAESNVGNYAIDGSGLSADNSNYVFAQAAGNATALTIDPATLTYTATGASQTYGGATPTLTGTVTGFVNGQTLADATTGTLTFTPRRLPRAMSAPTRSTVRADRGNGNYVFVQAAGNASALTVDPATLTYTASGASQTYGGATPTLSGTVTGFVNGQNASRCDDRHAGLQHPGDRHKQCRPTRSTVPG